MNNKELIISTLKDIIQNIEDDIYNVELDTNFHFKEGFCDGYVKQVRTGNFSMTINVNPIPKVLRKKKRRTF
jgi:hypothetical protein